MKQYKNIIFNVLTALLIILLSVCFYQQFLNNNKNNELDNIILNSSDSLVLANRSMVLALNNNTEEDFNLLEKSFNQINLNYSTLSHFYSDNKDFLNGHSVQYDNFEKEIKNLLESLKLIINNKKALLYFNSINKENNIIFSELEVIKATIDSVLKNNYEISKDKKFLNAINSLTLQLKKIEEIKNDVLNPLKQEEYKRILNNFISYIDTSFGEIDQNNMLLQKSISDFSRKLKQFRIKVNTVIDEKFDINAINEIQKNKNETYKNFDLIQRDLSSLLQNKDLGIYYYLILFMVALLVLESFYFINAKAEINKKDYNKIKQYEALYKRSSAIGHAIDRIVKISPYDNKIIIETSSFIDENTYKESKLSTVATKFNSLLRTYGGLRYKMDVLSKSAQELATPVVNLLPILKKENGNSINIYALNELNFASETIKDVKQIIEVQKNKLDVLTNNIQNISINLNETNNILDKNQERFNNTRSNMQNSSKQVKKIGEISQKTNDLLEDIKLQISNIGVISLNLAIESAQNKESSSATLVNELQNVIDAIEELNNQLKLKNEEIQSSAKDITNSLEKTTNEIVDDSELLQKTQKLIETLSNLSNNVGDSSEEILTSSEKVENLIKMLDEKIDTSKEKDNKKSDVINRSEQALNRILDTLEKD